jgi:hypothetical protein
MIARGSTPLDLHGIGPSGAARLPADVGDIHRFASRDRFASWNGTAPLDASSGEQQRHRLSRAGNRRINRTLHIMGVVQLRNLTAGRLYFDSMKAAGKTSMEAMRALKRRLSNVVYARMLGDQKRREAAGSGGHSGTTLQSSVTGLRPGRDRLALRAVVEEAGGQARLRVRWHVTPPGKTSRPRTPDRSAATRCQPSAQVDREAGERLRVTAAALPPWSPESRNVAPVRTEASSRGTPVTAREIRVSRGYARTSAVEDVRAAVGADGTGRCDALVEHDGTPAIVSTKRKLDPGQPRTHG